jgi:hypothetical protein
MPGLLPKFTMRDINARIDRFEKEKTRKMFEVLSYVGIESVKFAKQNHTYEDQTGNLTSSIGYAIIHDGKIQKSMMAEESAKVIDELARQYTNGMVLVVVAGMEYAAAVESKGYDVITGSSMYADSELLPFMRERLGIAFT